MDYTYWRDYITATSEWHGNTSWEHIDECMPWIRTPSFIQAFGAEGFNEHLLRAVPYTGNKVLRNPVVYPVDHHKYDYFSPVVKYMAQFYPFETIRVVKDWANSTAMLVWHLGNNYRLDARCSVVRRGRYERSGHGYFTFNLIFREKKNSLGMKNNGAEELIKFMRVLQDMKGAPRAIHYTPHGRDDWDMYGDPLEALDIEKPHTTDQLRKLWKRKLGGILTDKPCPLGGDNIWLAERYRPKDMIPIQDLDPKSIVPEFEDIISSR